MVRMARFDMLQALAFDTLSALEDIDVFPLPIPPSLSVMRTLPHTIQDSEIQSTSYQMLRSCFSLFFVFSSTLSQFREPLSPPITLHHVVGGRMALPFPLLDKRQAVFILLLQVEERDQGSLNLAFRIELNLYRTKLAARGLKKNHSLQIRFT